MEVVTQPGATVIDVQSSGVLVARHRSRCSCCRGSDTSSASVRRRAWPLLNIPLGGCRRLRNYF